jgi:hypothetical protein
VKKLPACVKNAWPVDVRDAAGVDEANRAGVKNWFEWEFWKLSIVQNLTWKILSKF